MDISEESKGSVIVLGPKGRVDSNTAKEFEEKLLGLLNGGAKSLVIDLEGLGYISSAGLRVLLMAAKRAKALNTKLALCAMPKPIKDVFDMSGFSPIFAIHKALDEAVASVQ